jgi:hypothetical protein
MLAFAFSSGSQHGFLLAFDCQFHKEKHIELWLSANPNSLLAFSRLILLNQRS